MPSLPKFQLAAFLPLCHLQHHPRRLLCTSPGIIHGENQLDLLNQLPPTEGAPQPAAPVAEPAQPAAPSHPVSPPTSRPTTRSSANQNSAPRSELRSPPTPGRTNENSRLSPPLRRSERLKAAAQHINRPTQATPAHSSHTINMARTYPYSLSYDTCLDQQKTPSASPAYISRSYTVASAPT